MEYWSSGILGIKSGSDLILFSGLCHFLSLYLVCPTTWITAKPISYYLAQRIRFSKLKKKPRCINNGAFFCYDFNRQPGPVLFLILFFRRIGCVFFFSHGRFISFLFRRGLAGFHFSGILRRVRIRFISLFGGGFLF